MTSPLDNSPISGVMSYQAPQAQAYNYNAPKSRINEVGQGGQPTGTMQPQTMTQQAPQPEFYTATTVRTNETGGGMHYGIRPQGGNAFSQGDYNYILANGGSDANNNNRIDPDEWASWMVSKDPVNQDTYIGKLQGALDRGLLGSQLQTDVQNRINSFNAPVPSDPLPTNGYDGSGINPGNVYGGGTAPNGSLGASPPIGNQQTPNSGAAGPLPQYGLSGFENAITSGLGAGVDALNSSLDSVNQTLGLSGNAAVDQIGLGYTQANDNLQSGINAFDPFVTSGNNAQLMQANLSGANGADAQTQAYANFQDSPAQQYLRDQAEKSLLRNTSAIGGLGGGRVRQELQRQAVGLASQDYQNQFNNLGSISDRGMNAVTNQGNIYRDQANLAQSSSQNIANIVGNIGSALAAAIGSTGAALANLYQNAGSNIAGARQQAGRDIAGAIDGTSSALAGLINQQGSGLSDIIGQDAINLMNLYQSGAALTAKQQSDLAAILANITTRSQSGIANAISSAGYSTGSGILNGANGVNTALGNINNAFGNGEGS